MLRKSQTAVLILLGGSFCIAFYLLLLSFGIFSAEGETQAADVPAGCQEIVWLESASAFGDWERIAEAVQWVVDNPPDSGKPWKLKVKQEVSTLESEIPEIVLWQEGHEDQKLFIRWYKFSSELEIPQWIDKLTKRPTPPLAIVGGTNTRRAVELSKVLDKNRKSWSGQAPLFLITTATSDLAGDRPLMDYYKKRNYRFSFTNSRMTEAVFDFVPNHPEIWQDNFITPEGITSLLATTNPIASTGLTSSFVYGHRYAMYTVTWKDDKFSEDLGNKFGDVFREHYPDNKRNTLSLNEIPQNIGDYYTLTKMDIYAQRLVFDTHLQKHDNTRKYLVLPTGSQRASRFLRTTVNMAPQMIENMVVLSGDSISFNSIYRDRIREWNILDLPVPLVFFCHRNPVDEASGFRVQPTNEKPWATSGTQDLLLYRDIFDAVLQACFRKNQLIADADTLDKTLQSARWHRERVTLNGHGVALFDANRNRQKGTGEHVVLMKPLRDGLTLLARSNISVWYRDQTPTGQIVWRRRTSPDLSAVPYYPLVSGLE